MAAPSKNYTLIPDTSVDADSPLDTTLLTQIRDNLIHIEEWLGDGYAAAKNHDHDNVNSKAVNGLGVISIEFPIVTHATATYTDKASVQVYIPPGAVKLYAQVRLRGGAATATGYARLRIGSDYGTEGSVYADTYQSVTLDITPSSGNKGVFVTLVLQLKNSSTYTTYCHKTLNAGDDNINYVPASYFSNQ